MPSLVLPPLYAILDPAQIKDRAPESVLRELLEGGAAILQLRVKTMAPSDFFQLAQRARAETRTHGCKLIVNDRVDIALACHADGVHLGQEDLPLAVGRKLMAAKLVGISTHNVEQAQQAERNGADYIGFGPMFGTTTKDTGYAARGVDMLRKIRAAVKLPIVAIGGINEQNVREVWQAGANSAAIISDILGANDITAKTKRILTSRSAV
ncbi:MAG TPA: thiamine phosphate synthase [Candidatus Binatia bacterium]|jgi:thiamine-phosphate pyrophosphorylase|nr:thiamine phosphate synthase [Candidatus Binatia bacterium]